MSGPPKVKFGAQRGLQDDGIRSFDDDLRALLDVEYPDWKNPGQTYMVPSELNMKEDDRGKLAEKIFYDLLEAFGKWRKEPMFVVHSYRFEEKMENWMNSGPNEDKSKIGEHDFVLINQKHGVIFLQVKAAKEDKQNKAALFLLAKKQLLKDEYSLRGFATNNFEGRLRKKMKDEAMKSGQYPVCPNLVRGASAHASSGIFKEDCEDVQAFSRWWDKNILPRRKASQAVDQEVYENLVMHFVGMHYSCDEYGVRIAIDETFKALLDETHKRLEGLLNSPAEHSITGAAGTGKTCLLIEKVKKLCKHQDGSEEKILVVCFNRPLSKMLEQEFENFCHKVEVKTFDQLCCDITGTGFDPNQEMKQRIHNALKVLKGKALKYDHIFVDECQDLMGDEWPILFKELWKGNGGVSGTTAANTHRYKRNKWFLFDENQFAGWPGKNSQTFSEAYEKGTNLFRVLRNSGNIFNQSKKYLQSNDPNSETILGPKKRGLNIKWVDSLPSRQVPEEMGAQSVADCINDLRQKKVSEEDVCVLVETVPIRDRLSAVLKKLNVDNHNAEERFEGNKKNKVVVVESIGRFKGLESKVVILYNPEFTLKGNNPTKELLYTAVSRCFCYLVIITTKEGMAALQSEDGVNRVGSLGDAG